MMFDGASVRARLVFVGPRTLARAASRLSASEVVARRVIEPVFAGPAEFSPQAIKVAAAHTVEKCIARFAFAGVRGIMLNVGMSGRLSRLARLSRVPQPCG